MIKGFNNKTNEVNSMKDLGKVEYHLNGIKYELRKISSVLETVADKFVELNTMKLRDRAFMEDAEMIQHPCVIRTLFLKELLENGWICERYAIDVVSDTIRIKSFENYLKKQGVVAVGEYISQIRNLYRYACERGIKRITKQDLYDFQHYYGNETHAVRHSAINYFVKYLRETSYRGCVRLWDEEYYHSCNRYAELDWSYVGEF